MPTIYVLSPSPTPNPAPVDLGNNATFSTANNVVMTVTSAVSIGEVVVVMVEDGNASITGATVADSRGNTYPLITSASIPGFAYAEMFSRVLTTALQVGDTITYTNPSASGSANKGINGLALPGFSTIDGATTNANYNGVAPTFSVTGAGPAAVPSEIYIGFAVGENTLTIARGWTETPGITGFPSDTTAYQVNTGTAPLTFSGTLVSQGVASIIASFRPVGPIPTVTSVVPNSGFTTGGTSVVITGTNFTGATAVKFGTINASSFVVNSSTQITAVSPVEVAGTIDIFVTNGFGTSLKITADQYTYISSAPTVTSVVPNGGTPSGGTSVVITGTLFTGATAVKFGTVAAASFVVNSATQITAVSPAEAAGTVDITVTTPQGTSATGSADQFSFSSGISSINLSSPLPVNIGAQNAGFIICQITITGGPQTVPFSFSGTNSQYLACDGVPSNSVGFAPCNLIAATDIPDGTNLSGITISAS